jgi:hypothetical protein
MSQYIIENPRKSLAGNWTFSFCHEGKRINVTLNSKWKQAEQEARATKTKNKQPTFLLIVEGPRKDKDFNGTGATWAMTRKEGRVHQGNITLDNQSWWVDIKKLESADCSIENSKFSVTLTSQKPVNLDEI